MTAPRQNEPGLGEAPAHLLCGAKTPSGPCRNTPEPGKRRCRLHGGAPGSGAQPGNRNAVKHGRFTRAAIEERHATAEYVRTCMKLLDEIGR